MRILSIDTSCDETSASVTENTQVLSNVIWSQAAAHAKFGGVMPSLAQRMHEERISFVIDKAMQKAKVKMQNLDAIAVTIGPGLSIALGVGVNKAKELGAKFNKKLIAVNHLEGHILSPFAQAYSVERIVNSSKTKRHTLSSTKHLSQASLIHYPALGLVISGGNTQLIQINKIGDYKILAETQDDALGEALDKSARMLGLGYPGGAILEKFAKLGEAKSYSLPIPIVGQEKRMIFTYSGLKTAMMRLVENEKVKNGLSKDQIYNLAASFQNVAFIHIVRVLSYFLKENPNKYQSLLVGGGVAANIEIRKRLRKLSKENKIDVLFPYSNKLYGDNAAMIGIAAYFKSQRGEFTAPEKIDRNPRAKLD